MPNASPQELLLIYIASDHIPFNTKLKNMLRNSDNSGSNVICEYGWLLGHFCCHVHSGS